MSSYRQQMFDWLDGLPDRSWFWGGDAPVPGSTARPILSRLAADPESLVSRVGHGLYFKAGPDDWTKTFYCCEIVSALMCAGPGAGLAGPSALNALGWTTQVPAKINVASLRRVPTFRVERYHLRSNRLREALTWTEVTVLEALLLWKFAEVTWERCMDKVGRGVSASRLPWNFLEPFRLDNERLQQVARFEKCDNLPLLRYRIEVLSDLAAQIPAPANAAAA